MGQILGRDLRRKGRFRDPLLPGRISPGRGRRLPLRAGENRPPNPVLSALKYSGRSSGSYPWAEMPRREYAIRSSIIP